jgi:hypothetical protein
MQEDLDGKTFSPKNDRKPKESRTQRRKPAIKIFGRVIAANDSGCGLARSGPRISDENL